MKTLSFVVNLFVTALLGIGIFAGVPILIVIAFWLLAVPYGILVILAIFIGLGRIVTETQHNHK